MLLGYCCTRQEEASFIAVGHVQNESPFSPLVSVYLFILSVTKPVLSDYI